MALLEVKDLSLAIGTFPILHDVDLSVDAGEVLGVIGESGSGKSMTALSIMQLLPEGAVTGGSIRLDGREVLGLPDREMRAIRGHAVGMVFQEPMTALNPVKTIGDQVAETAMIHGRMSRTAALEVARETLDRVELPADRFPLERYPHELSGGQRQRVVIAMAIAMRPKLLIADEPTTALDVTTQAQILKLLQRLVDEDGMGLIFITHDLGVVAGLADKVAIMRRGEVVEAGPTVSRSATSGIHTRRRCSRPHRTRRRESRPRTPVARRCWRWMRWSASTRCRGAGCSVRGRCCGRWTG
jgi:peptide/nickel transport system ATP-binding protein